jgi:MoxR-like ATPase
MVKLDYTTYDEEKRNLALGVRGEVVELEKLLKPVHILNMQKLVRSIPVGEVVIDYVTRLVRSTRPGDPLAPDFVKKMVDYGAGVRAGQFLIQAGQAFAAMDGRPAVSEEDVQKAALPVLRHRINTNFQAQAEGKTSEDIIRQLLAAVGPREEGKYERRKR